jgi:hypothetical protein
MDDHNRRLTLSGGRGLEDLHREARASVVLILITFAVVLTISFIGFAVS